MTPITLTRTSSHRIIHSRFDSGNGEGLRIATWNINGLRSGLKQVKDFLADYDIDVLALQEIKIDQDSISDEIKQIGQYAGFFNPADKKGYSGTAIYSRIKPRAIKLGLGEALVDAEGRVMMADFGKIKLHNFYFPHSSRDLRRLDFKLNFNRLARNYLEKNLDSGLVVCGDLNVAHQEIDLAKPKQNIKNAGFTRPERDDFEKFLKLGLIDIYRYKYPSRQQFTWWGHFHNCRERNIGWRIDYFLIPKEKGNKVKKVEILDRVYGSDHCPVMIEF